MLVNGQWKAKWVPVQQQDEEGRFVRQSSSFRENVIEPVAGRYHLYVALICPWAHRTLITRKLKGLQDTLSVSIVAPFLTDEGWQFAHREMQYDGAEADPLNGFTHMHQLYTQSDAGYTGRATVPVLWDKQENRIVNNESADIVRLLNHAFTPIIDSNLDLYPEALREEIDTLNEAMYHRLNNGVYKAGFAQSQEAHDEAVTGVFAMLDELEERLSDDRAYLFGDALTESDIRLYVTLARFDVAYHGLFKCNLKRIADYPHLHAYLERLYAIPAFGETTNIRHIKDGYYSIKALNPSGIVPLGPKLSTWGKHG